MLIVSRLSINAGPTNASRQDDERCIGPAAKPTESEGQPCTLSKRCRPNQKSSFCTAIPGRHEQDAASAAVLTRFHGKKESRSRRRGSLLRKGRRPRDKGIPDSEGRSVINEDHEEIKRRYGYGQMLRISECTARNGTDTGQSTVDVVRRADAAQAI